MHADDRPKAVLRALVAFAKERDRWPDGRELRAYRKHLGCETTVLAVLRSLRQRGAVELHGGTHRARFIVTPLGFGAAQRVPFVPGAERLRARADAVNLRLAQPLPKHSQPLTQATIDRMTSNLPIVG